MFTGIVQGQGQVRQIVKQQDLNTHTLWLPSVFCQDLRLGASIAHNGCCLTITEIDGDLVSFDLMAETLKLTNLGELEVGDWVNLERAARFGDEIGGHAMSGHIMCTASLDEIIITPNNRTLWLAVPESVQKYIFPKGFIGVDGISLTVGEVVANRFSVHLIPETLERTNLAERQKGDRINIEIDAQTQATVDTVERVLSARSK